MGGLISPAKLHKKLCKILNNNKPENASLILYACYLYHTSLFTSRGCNVLADQCAYVVEGGQ